MTRHRGLLGAALTFASLSAVGLGAGILGLYPILQNILPAKGATTKTLAEMLQPAVQQLAGWGVRVPPEWLARLPTDPFPTVLLVVLGLGVLTVIGAACNFLHAYCSLTIVSRVIANIRATPSGERSTSRSARSSPGGLTRSAGSLRHGDARSGLNARCSLAQAVTKV